MGEVVKMHVGLALESEVEAVVDMIGDNVRETLKEPFDPDKIRALFQRYLDEANPIFYVCREGLQPIGVMLSWLVDYDYRDGFYATQRVLYVKPEKRGTRAAVLLLQHLIRESERLGADAIHGGNDNGFRSDRTAAFLEHFGFERVGYDMMKRLPHGQEEQRQ